MAITQHMLCASLFFTWKITSTNSQFHPFDNGPDRLSYEQLMNSDIGDRTSLTIDSLSINGAAISLLFKVKLYPFRKKIERREGSTARFGGPNTSAGLEDGDRGVVVAGLDFGLPGGSGFGYGSQTSLKTFSFSRVSYFAK